MSSRYLKKKRTLPFLFPDHLQIFEEALAAGKGSGGSTRGSFMQQRKTRVSVVFALDHLKSCTFLDCTTFFS